MNLPNKLTLSRIILSFVIILLLLTPFDAFGIEFPQLFVNELLKVDSKYVIAGVLFVIASLTDMFDGKLARKRNQVTDLGKMLDAIADKVLVNCQEEVIGIKHCPIQNEQRCDFKRAKVHKKMHPAYRGTEKDAPNLI